MMKKVFLLLMITVLFLVMNLTACMSENAKTNNENSYTISESSSETVTKVVFDVSQFANISSEELVEIMGKPSKITNSVYSGFAEIQYTVYDYDSHKLGAIQFDLINDKVSAFTINGELPYNNGEFLRTLNVETDGAEERVEGQSYTKYLFPNKNIDLVHAALIDFEKDTYKWLSVRFESKYYEEWPLLYTAEEQGHYQYLTENTIKNYLLIPDSAEFPWLDWTYGKNDYYFYVSSYVNSQNAFGVEIRNEFTFIYYVDTEMVAYAILGDEILVDNGYIPTSVYIEELVKSNQGVSEDNTSDEQSSEENTEQHPNDNTSTNVQGNNVDELWDAVAEYCNRFNESYRTYGEVISFVVHSGTEVTVTHSAYELAESELDYILNARDIMLDDLIAYLETYDFHESITVTVYEDYCFLSNDYEAEFSSDYEDDYSEEWVYQENDIDTLIEAVNAFCDSYHICDYECYLHPNVTSNASVDIYHTIESLIPVEDSSKIASIDKRISNELEDFIRNYADFPQDVLIRVIPDYFYDTGSY